MNLVSFFLDLVVNTFALKAGFLYCHFSPNSCHYWELKYLANFYGFQMVAWDLLKFAIIFFFASIWMGLQKDLMSQELYSMWKWRLAKSFSLWNPYKFIFIILSLHSFLVRNLMIIDVCLKMQMTLIWPCSITGILCLFNCV